MSSIKEFLKFAEENENAFQSLRLKLKKLEGWKNYYISDKGNVYNLSTGKLLKKHFHQGYFAVTLCEGKKRKTLGIKKLLSLYFPDQWKEELLSDELWMPVRGYEGYFITSKGRCWSSWSHSWAQPWPDKNPPGYYWVISLGTRKQGPVNHSLHKIVGRHFLDWSEGKLICHRNENLPFPNINFAENLYVGSYSDNNRDAVSKGRSGYNPLRGPDGRFC